MICGFANLLPPFTTTSAFPPLAHGGVVSFCLIHTRAARDIGTHTQCVYLCVCVRYNTNTKHQGEVATDALRRAAEPLFVKYQARSQYTSRDNSLNDG